MLRRTKGDMQERPPFRPLGFPNQGHLRFVRKPISFHGVTRNAGADDVFPRRVPATIPRDHVIEIQIVAIEHFAAVLAGVLVALKYVMAGELYFLLRQTIEEQKDDDSRHANPPRNRLHELVVGGVTGKIAPAFEVVSQEIVGVVR